MPPLPVTPAAPLLFTPETYNQHFEAISFFLLLLFLSARGLQLFLNHHRKALPSHAEITFHRAMLISLLSGLALFVATSSLAMAAKSLIPQASFLPDVWSSLKIRPYQVQATTIIDRRDQRLASLNRLATALLSYAAQHAGKFPNQKSDLAADLWRSPDPSAYEYQYVSGLTANDRDQVLVYEPDIFGQTQFRLLANGEIREVPSQFAPPPTSGAKLP